MILPNHDDYSAVEKTKLFLRYSPANFLMTGYTIEYYTNQNQSNTYETFPDEIRHKGQLLSQLQLIRVGIDQYIFLGADYAYGLGTTREST